MELLYRRSPKRNWLSATLVIAMTLVIMLNPLAALANETKQATPSPLPALFSDVTGDDPNYVFINYAVKRGLLTGYPDGSFHPDEGLTRAQAASLLAKGMHLSKDETVKSPFPDVPADHWAQSAIAASSRAGLLRGFEDGTFRPDEPLTRIQSVALLLRLEKTPLPVVKRSFTDVSEDHWAKRQAAVAAETGLVDLRDSKVFSPNQTFTRREMARALSMLYTLAPSLRETELPMTLVVKEGKTTLTTNSASQQIKGETSVKPGDSIWVETGSAELLFEDGTGMLLKNGTRMTVKEGKGRAYIKSLGMPGISVDWLRVEMPDGETIGVLATNRILRKEHTTTPNAMLNPSGLRLASTDENTLTEALKRFRLAEEAQEQGATGEEWWKVSAEEKTRIQMDMAWGVAAVQGTRFAARGNSGGTGSFSVMDGRGSISAAGQSFAVPPGLETTVATPGQPPAPPAPLSPAAIESFVAAQSFLTQQAARTVQNQPTPVALPPALQAQLAPTIAPTPVPPAVPPAIQSLYQSINQEEVAAATALSNNAAPPPPTPVIPTRPTHHSGPTPLALGTVAPPEGQVGVSYSATISATGGTGNKTYEIITGNLPTGLSFENGIISGTPASNTHGIYTFTVRATDSASPPAAINHTYTLVISTYKQHFMFDSETGTIIGYNPQGGGDPQWDDDSQGGIKVVIPTQIDGSTVVTIGNGAFLEKGITSVILPKGLQSIGDSAFEYNPLTSITIPNNVTSIGALAFKESALTSVTLPNGVTSIGDEAFAGNALTSVKIPNSVTSLGAAVFESNHLTDVTLPNCITSIGHHAFTGNLLTSVTIPTSVDSIGAYAFMGNALTSVTIPSGVTSIGDYAFAYNDLTSVNISNSVTNIGRYAFRSNSLSNVTIPNGVAIISNGAFFDNVLLTEVTLPDNVNVGDMAFQNDSLSSITIGTSVTLGDYLLNETDNSFRFVYIEEGKGTYTLQEGNWIKQVITPASITPVAAEPVSATAVTIGHTLSSSILSGTFQVSESDTTSVDGTLIWDSPGTTVNETGLFGWRFIPDNSTMYNVVTGTITVTANPLPNPLP
ncbi:leucine-rich repeat protein [Heliobacterium chlorum]|uniref:Leucine-rich repeat protein n=1 Tax=Heliobacterium chlorum TaxID=2698 RepID=A0ABR7T3W4_HELCL|nr:leucine-rich repeat protein [Heliobacterium chlorum]MBC9785356.1 leucine-rich repeat protein [Heliobacterium chlorum]